MTIDRERRRHRAGDAEPAGTPERDEPRARSRAARRLRGDRCGPDVPRHRADRCGPGLLRGPRPERGREPAGDGRDGTGAGGHDGPEAHRRTRAPDAGDAATDHRRGERRGVRRRARARAGERRADRRARARASTSRSSASGCPAATSACRGCCRASSARHARSSSSSPAA